MSRNPKVPRALRLLIALPLLAAAQSAGAPRPQTLPAARIEAVRFLPASGGEGSPVDGQFEVRFAGRRLSRTVVRCQLAVAAGFAQLNELGFYNVGLSGEVRRDESPVERFDYRFAVAAGAEPAARLALEFDRDLRPGRYRLHLELEDLESGRRIAGDNELEVPELLAPQPSVSPQQPLIRLQLPDTPILIGLHRVTAVMRSGLTVDRVRFLLDGVPLLTKSRPPFGVELDFGSEGAMRSVAVEACDASGVVLARDERRINAGVERFALELESPRSGTPTQGATVVRARLTVPSGRVITNLDYFLGDQPVLGLEWPPFDRAVSLPPREDTTVVRAVARLSDGRTVEDTMLINAPDLVAETSVHLVELYVAVVDRRGRSVDDLSATQFRVHEDGRLQRITRFERVADLPLHLSLLLDVSGSMQPQLVEVARAATSLLHAALKPSDRASVTTFNGSPQVVVGATNDLARLANGLAMLRAGGDTGIHEALEFSLRELEGVAGQRAILLFSDGKESNPRDASALVEYARRGAVTLYTVGFDLPREAVEARSLLQRLADETGGRSFFVDDVGELESAYSAMVREMRSRYLVAYQSDNPDGTGFRSVGVALDRRGLEPRAARGYYP